MIRNGVDDPNRSSADSYAISYHGSAFNHLDALSHFFHNGKMYNGFSQQEVTRREPENSIFLPSRTVSLHEPFWSIFPDSRVSPTWNRERQSTRRTWKRGRVR